MAWSLLISAWIAGALGTFHCLGMCGGFLGTGADLGSSPPARRSTLPVIRAAAESPLVTHLGRVSTYMLLGMLVGTAGGLMSDLLVWQPLQRALYVLANLALLGLALSIVARREVLAGLQQFGARLFARVAPALWLLRHRHGVAARFARGLLWGLVPCPLIYGVLPLALFAGGPGQGAAVMLAFGIGTLPALAAAGWAVARAAPLAGRPAVRRAAAALIGGFGAVGIWRALFDPLAGAQGAFCLTP